MAAHRVDHYLDGFGHKRRPESQHTPVARCSAQDQAQHIASPLIAREHSVCHEEGDGSGVVGDHSVRNHALVALLVGVSKQLLDSLDDRPEQVGLIVAGFPLKHRGDALHAHARVNAGPGQRAGDSIGSRFELHEHQVPELPPAFALVGEVAVRAMAGTVFGAPVVVDL